MVLKSDPNPARLPCSRVTLKSQLTTGISLSPVRWSWVLHQAVEGLKGATPQPDLGSQQTHGFFKNLAVVPLQCCARFCCTAKGISYESAHIPSLQGLPPTTPVPLGHHRAPGRAPCAVKLLPRAIYYTRGQTPALLWFWTPWWLRR